MYTATETEAKPLYRGTQVVWCLLAFLEVILILRFVLKLLGADPHAGFVSFFYALTAVLVAPFLRVIHSTHVLGNTFEFATLLAMFAFWLVAVAISAMVRAIPGKGNGNCRAKQKRQAHF